MRFFSRKVMAFLLATLICLSSVTGITVSGASSLKDGEVPLPIIPPSAATGKVTVIKAGGWLESVYAEWQSFSGATSYNVYYKLAAENDSAFLPVDSPLVRNNRVDILGLKGGTEYTIKIAPVTSGGEQAAAATTFNATPNKHDRSGYAHFKYTEGVGAYNDDGTPKANAKIIYVTQATKNTVTIPGFESATNGKGIGWILNGNLALMQAVTSQHPLIVRFIGTVALTPDDGLTGYNSTLNGGTEGDNGYMAIIKDAKNLTIEGVGVDTVIDGWGISLFHSAKQTNGGKNYEIRNLTFKNYPEDAVGIQGEMSGGKLTAPIERVWIHHNTFFGGYCANPTESDKAQGDGSCDFKRGQYYTLSYNYFEDCKKTNLIGASDDNLQFHMTFHHNWWNNAISRTPLVRQANIHIYNNYFQSEYDGSSLKSSQTIDSRANAYVFAEANTFNTVNRPHSTTSGSVVKSYNDVLFNCLNGSTATLATSREQQVSSNNTYPNFDTNPSIFYYDSVNKKSDVANLTDAGTAKAEVMAYSGVMKDVPAAPESKPIIEESKIPSKPVTLPYEFDLTADGGVGVVPATLAVDKTVITEDNVSFTPAKAFKTADKIMTLKSENVVFRLDRTAKITIKDGAGSNSAVLYDGDGKVWADKDKPGPVEVPPGVYGIQSANSSKEAKLGGLKIEAVPGGVVVGSPVVEVAASSRSGEKAASLEFTSSKAGTYYIVSYVGAKPTAAQIIDNSQAVSGTVGESSVATVNLTVTGSETSFALVVVSNDKDTNGNGFNSNVVSFTIPEWVDPSLPQISKADAARAGQNTGTVKLTSSIAGTAYYIVNGVSDPIPDKSAVKAGTNAGAVSTSTTTLSVSGLPATEARVDVIVEASGKQSNVASFVIPEWEDPDIPKLTLGEAKRVSETSATVTFTSSVAGTAYYLISDATPDKAAVRAGTNGGAVTTSEKTLELAVPSAATKVWLIVENNGKQSSIIDFSIPEYKARGMIEEHYFMGDDGKFTSTDKEGFFVVGGSPSAKSGASVTYGGKNITTPMKMESSRGDVTFTLEDEATLTLAFATGNAGLKFKISTIADEIAIPSDGVYTVKLPAGTHTVSRGASGEKHLGYIGIEYAAGGGTVTPPATVPGIPETATATGGVNQATINWTAPSSNGGAEITKYQVSRDGSNWTDVIGHMTYTF
ncbi:MAG: hypothetical protein LBR74_00890, partial [Eubacterium sp.]|nr:hypothetical protein [Eubacterium sp.]